MSNTKACTGCGKVKEIDMFHVGKYACKVCVAKYHKGYLQKNKEAVDKQKKEYYQKNKEVIAKRTKEYYQNHKEAMAEYSKTYRRKNKKVLAEKKKEHRQNNKEMYYEYTFVSTRLTQRHIPVPSWYDADVVVQIRKECKRISEETGILHHVDHVFPLRGKTVSGLHVQDNLQIISAKANVEKNNKLILPERLQHLLWESEDNV